MTEEKDDAHADAELSRRITAELGYIHGLIDAIRAAPGKVDVAVFLNRIERVVAALEAVQGKTADWDAYAHGNGEWPEDGLAKGVVVAGVAVTRGITRQIASALRIEAPGAAESQTADHRPDERTT
jgi:hypothetical protein